MPSASRQANPGDARERRLVWLLCALAAVHVFVFSAAFPFFSNIDEHTHFDLVLKCSHGQWPHGFENLGAECCEYMQAYGSPEFLSPPNSYPDGRYPTPFWTAAGAVEISKSPLTLQQAATDMQSLRVFEGIKNYESGQQPIYYVLAGAWCRLGRECGLAGPYLIYWLRFLNILFVVALVPIGYSAARLVFPEQAFPRLAVVVLLAFMPVHSFYLIGNDVLSPLSFGLAFICLVRLWQTEEPGIALGAGTGLALAAVYLQKLSNAPLLAASGIFLAVKIFRLLKAKKLRASLPALACLGLCAGLPMAAWLVWTKHAFGDFAGTAAKIHFMTWTPKPFGAWFHHPMFSPSGIWTFVSALIITFWQGELWWHGQPLHLPATDTFYVVSSLSLILFCFAGFLPRYAAVTPAQRPLLWFALAVWLSTGVLLGWLSIGYDFGIGGSPSREYPFFTAGRLLLGGLIPFLLVYASGLNFLLRHVTVRWVRPAVLTAIVLFMMVSEIVTGWTVFSSQYNWYHL